jgi:hypothetical protein
MVKLLMLVWSTTTTTLCKFIEVGRLGSYSQILIKSATFCVIRTPLHVTLLEINQKRVS